MAGGTVNWFVVVPDATRNLVSNPSFEFGTAGWAGTNTPTLGTAADDQQSGAWAAQFTGAAGTVGIRAPISGAVAGGTYVASAYVRMRGTSGGQVRISLGGTSYTTTLGTGEGWTRVSVGSVNAVGSVAVQRASGALGTLWVDAVQVEASPNLSSLTTYIDGDQAGGVWEGAPHASPSYRGAQARSGGTLIPMAAIGFRPQETPDTGMWPITNILQSYAVNAGAEYQRARPTERTFTLMATMTGTTLADQHVTRREVIDVLKIERVTPAQPNRLYYTGATGTSYIDAYYDSGLGWGGANVIADEDAAVRFVAADPAWYGVAQEGTSLAPYTVLGSTNYIAYRDPEGRWGTMQTGGTSVNGTVFALYANNGTVFAGGSITVAGGTLARSVAQWSGGSWGTLTGGTLSYLLGVTFGVSALYQSAAGTLFVGGDFDAAAGTTANRIAQWTAAGFGTLANGSAMASTALTVYSIVGRPEGGIYVGGEFNSAGGTQARYVAQWAGAWGTLGPGTVDNIVLSVVPIGNGSIIIGGAFSAVAGTTAPAIAQWASGRGWGTLAGGTIANPGNTLAVRDLALAPDYSIYAGGAIAQPGTGVVRYRSSYTPAGTVISTAVFAGGVRSLLSLPNGYLYAGGIISQINGVLSIPVGLALWNGYSWLPPDLILSTNADAVRALAQDASGTLYMGGEFRGIGTAASVTTVVNSGIAESYPTLRLLNRASGTARIYQILNTTTNDNLWLDYVMTPSEILTLVTTPGNRSFTSSTRGNVFGAILGGSNIASWRLLPGTNTISFFADNPSVQADLFWNPRHASIDGGAQAVI